MTPEELGLTVCNLEELIGGTPEENAQITRNILSGSLKGPKRDVVVLNAAISLYLGIDDCTVRDCIKTAQDIIDSGAAMAKMEEFIQATKKAAGEVKRHDTGYHCPVRRETGGAAETGKSHWNK